MGPHSNNLDNSLFIEHLVHKAVFDVDAPGAGPGQIARQLFERRGISPRVLPENFDQLFRLGLKTGIPESFRIFPSLPGKDDPPTHQPGSSEHSSTGVSSPSRMDSLIPGMDSR